MFRTTKEQISLFTWFVRWGIGLTLIVAGLVLLVFNIDGFGAEGFGLGAGAGGSVIMLNWLFRVGVAGDRERDREQAARDYLEVHGYWPDEAPGRRPPQPPSSRPPAA